MTDGSKVAVELVLLVVVPSVEHVLVRHGRYRREDGVEVVEAGWTSGSVTLTKVDQTLRGHGSLRGGCRLELEGEPVTEVLFHTVHTHERSLNAELRRRRSQRSDATTANSC